MRISDEKRQCSGSPSTMPLAVRFQPLDVANRGSHCSALTVVWTPLRRVAFLGMPAFEVRAAEVLDDALSAVLPNEPTPEVRTLVCRVEAVDADAAVKRESWARIWEAKYGIGRLPLQALVDVAQISEGEPE